MPILVTKNKFKNKFNPREIFASIKGCLLATQNTFGIDIGGGYVKIVQLQKSRGGYFLADYKVRAIPTEVKDNPKEKQKFIKEFINEFLAQAQIKTTLGRIAIEGSGIFIFSLLLPFLSDKDLRGAVGMELKKRLPYTLDIKNLFYGYFVTERFEAEEASQVMITCIAVNNAILYKEIEFLKSFGLIPITINTSTDALGNLVKAIGSEYRYTAVLDMGAKGSYLNFYKNGLLQFSREIPVGGERFTQGILKVLSGLGGDITFDTAEAFKKQCGLPMEDEAYTEFCTDLGSVKGYQIITGLRPILERLITEISRTTTFYFRTHKIDSLDVFYLTGGASRIRNIDKFLSKNLRSLSIGSIEKLNPLKTIKGWLDVGVFRQELVIEEAAPHLAVAFGLCIHKGGKVNLLPPKEKIEQRAERVMFVTRLTFPIILFAILILYIPAYLQVSRYRIEIKRLKSQSEQLAPIVKKINNYLSFKESFKHRETLLESAIGRQLRWAGILGELSRITPQEMTLQKLEFTSGENQKKQIIIKGEVVSEYTNLDLAISQYTLSLNESPYFSNVRLVSSERDMYSAIPKASFEIVCNLIY